MRAPHFDALQICIRSLESPSERSIIDVGTMPSSANASTMSLRRRGLRYFSSRYSYPANFGSGSFTSASTRFSRSSSRSPIYAAPRLPEIQIRSFCCAPPRDTTFSFGACPSAVRPSTSPVIEAFVSPPTRSIPCSLHAKAIPSYRSCNASTDILDDTPSDTISCEGSAFIASISLAATVTALYPRCLRGK